MEECCRIAALPPGQVDAPLQALENRARSLPVVAGVLVPALSNIYKGMLRAEAEHDVALTAVAMETFRLANGKLPEKLTDLTPKFLADEPLDPADGKPLRMVVRDKEVVIYSIGPDMKDDGGKPYDNTTKTGDIALTLPK
jgi:hypothetical protein